MATVPIPFVGPAYQARSKNLSAQRCINWYPVASEVGGSKIRALYPTPGLKRFLSIGTEAPIRGALSFDGRLWIVCGSVLYVITKQGQKTALGTLLTSTGPVILATNGNQIMLVDGAGIYLSYQVRTTNHTGDGATVTFAVGGLNARIAASIKVKVNDVVTTAFTVDADAGTITFSVAPSMSAAIVITVNDTFQEVEGDGYPVPTHCAFVGGYFAVNDRDTGRWYITALYDGGVIDILDFVTAEAAPDDIAALLTGYSEVWAFGTTTTEVWPLTGDADFPFRRQAVIEYGCAAPYSAAKAGTTMFWLSANDDGQGMIMGAAGYQAQRISTFAIEYALSTYERIDDAIGFAYQQEGHTFYVLTFPTANATWVYDVSTQQWHERLYWEIDAAKYSRHRANCHAFAFGLHLVGDYANGIIYSLDPDEYTDDDALIRRLRATDHVSQNLQSLTFNSLQVDMETGEMPQEFDEGFNPKAMLRYSKDGGHNWSSEHWADIGKVGHYGQRVMWRRLGQGRNRTFELTITEPVKVTIMDAVADIEVDA